MRKLIVPAVIVLFFAAAGISFSQETGPRIVFKELRYDAGKVAQGKQVSHVFEMSNAGTGTLVIERVQPG